jgi:DNA-binding SARP family transcriptional activator
VLRVQLFGTGQISYDNRLLAGFPNRQCCLLLCYLLLNRHHRHYRERLAAVFWGDYSTAASRKYLRNALWRLRCALQSLGVPVDEYLATGDHTVALIDSSAYSLDVEDFERVTGRFRDQLGQQLTAEQAGCLEQVIALYVGDLLENVYEDWCLHDRERLRLLYLDTLAKLVAFHEFQGTYERGLAYGEQYLAHDPTRERVHRQMMRLHWRSGDCHEALAQYKRCAQILREEMGIEPVARTRLLYNRMVHGEFDLARWPDRPGDDLPDQLDRVQSIQPVAQQLLERLNHLEEITNETNTELQSLRHLTNKLLLTVDR